MHANKVVSLFSKIREAATGGPLKYRLCYKNQIANREGWYIQVKGGGTGFIWRYAGIYPYKHYEYAKHKARQEAKARGGEFVEC